MMLQSPTTTSWLRTSPIEILITRACEPSLPEPNYALHLEVAEYVNTKKANNPREAAMAIARLANHRNPHVATLALALLDTLVQSCGYPFHLQISTKEFLNELVRRFPERPPPFPGPVMGRILDLINSWKEGICTESRWKEDLGNIRDMHRLLTFKGYRFRDGHRQQPSVAATAAANLKTAEELEEEDREAQSAKLQELIRRGTPRDLAAAQELMKSLAGANPDAKPDYRSQALTELNKLEQKVILLNEMLDNVDVNRGEKFVEGDAYDQVSAILKTARPKLQKWISDVQSDDPESLDTFLQINDQINSVMTRYEAFKKGDFTVAANPIPAELSSSSNSQPLSLIDFDESEAQSSAAPSNDLAGLFASPSPPQVSTAIVPSLFSPFASGPSASGTSFGTGSAPTFAPLQQPHQPHAPSPQLHNAHGRGFGFTAGPAPIQPTATPPASIMLPGTPSQNPSPPAPNYFNNTSFAKGPINLGGGMGMGFGGGALSHSQSPPQQPYQQFQPQSVLQKPQNLSQQQPIQLLQGQVQQQPQTTTAATNTNSTQQTKDPFADLAGIF